MTERILNLRVNNPTVSRAIDFSIYAHRDQKRKFTFEPYHEHPQDVAVLVGDFILQDNAPDDLVERPRSKFSEAIVTALLHDVVEDTLFTVYDLESRFGQDVARNVWFLSDSPKIAGNRATRKILDAERIKFGPPIVKIVKFFDNVHNLRSICNHDPKFFKKYLEEKEMLSEIVGYADFEYNGVRLPMELLTEENIREHAE